MSFSISRREAILALGAVGCGAGVAAVGGFIGRRPAAERGQPQPAVYPAARVVLTHEGTSAEMMDGEAEAVIDALAVLPDVAHLTAESTPGASAVTAYFRPGHDLDAAGAAIAEVARGLRYRKVAAAVESTATCTVPYHAGPALWLALRGPLPLPRLSGLAVGRLRQPLLSIAGTGDVTFRGWQEPVIRIDLVPEKLAAFDLTADEVVKVFREHQGSALRLPRRAGAPPGDVGEVLIPSATGRAVPLRDVAVISEGEEGRHIARLNEDPVVAVGLYPAGREDLARWARRVHNELPALQRMLPREVELMVAADLVPAVAVPGTADEDDALVVDVVGPPGSDLARMEGLLRAAERELRQVEGLADILTVPAARSEKVGDEARLYLNLAPAAERHRKRRDVRRDVHRALRNVPDLRVGLLEPSVLALPPMYRQPLTLMIQRPAPARLAALAERLLSELGRTAAFAELSADHRPAPSELSVSFKDRDVERRHKVSQCRLIDVLNTAVQYGPGPRFAVGGRLYEVRTPLGGPWLALPDALRCLYVRRDDGRKVPVADLVKAVERPISLVINRYNRQRAVSIFADPEPGVSAADARRRCRAAVAEVWRREAPEADYRVLLWTRNAAGPPEPVTPRRDR
jgi:multidrug efflux pump subunit AcrB